MNQVERILLLHDGDPIGDAVARQLRERSVPFRELPSLTRADEIVGAAFGSRAIIAVGDHFVSSPAVLCAAQVPGVATLVVITRGDSDLLSLKRSGIPYTVLRVGVLLEDIIFALSDVVEDGWLILGRDDDVRTNAVAADDVALCAISAVTEERVCGQVLSLGAPEATPISELATRMAHATGRSLKVSTWPRWAVAAVRAINRFPFMVPSEIRSSVSEDVLPLHPAPWRTIEAVATDLARRNDHAMGMQ